MPLSNNDRSLLRRAGFIPWEIRKLNEAVYPDGRPQVINLETEAWKAVIHSRYAWITDKLENGWSSKRISGAVMGYYIGKRERTPFDFLKVEYKPPRKLTDYQEAMQTRINKNIDQKLNLQPRHHYVGGHYS